MAYTFTKTLDCSLTEAISKVTQALMAEGFGILTDIDVQATLKNKINKDIPAYRILGACSPTMAYNAISAEPQIGTMLPCNVLVRELDAGKIEVAIIDPVASMQAVKNEALASIATEVQSKLKKVSEAL